MFQFNSIFIIIFKSGNGYITTAVLKEILRELDETLNNDDLDGKMMFIMFNSRNSKN